MNSFPFIAKVRKVNQKVALYSFQLPKSKCKVAYQLYQPQITEQFKPRVFFRADNVDMRGTMIVRENYYAPALE